MTTKIDKIRSIVQNAVRNCGLSHELLEKTKMYGDGFAPLFTKSVTAARSEIGRMLVACKKQREREASPDYYAPSGEVA